MITKSKTLLLVEDDVILALAEKMQLERYGYTVVNADSGEKAVELLKSIPGIDLILMDIDLGSGIDGTQAAEAILARQDIPIVFLSSHTEPHVVERTERISSYGYVEKSSSITVLDASIKMAFKLFDAKGRMAESEGKYRSIFNTLSEGVALNEVLLDGRGEMVDYRILEVNAAYRNVADYDRSMEPVGSLASELYRMDAQTIGTFWREHRGRAEAQHVEFISPIGRRIFLVSTSPFFDGRFVTTFSDITERKLVEKEKERQSALLKAIINGASEAIFFKDRGGVYQVINAAGAAMIGCSVEEVVGRTDVDLLPPGIAREFQEGDAKVISTRQSLEHEKDLVLNGRVLSYRVHEVPLLDERGEVTGIIGIATDVSELKRRKDALGKQISLLNTLIESIAEPIFAKDAQGRYVLLNRSGAELLGRPPSEILGYTARDVLPGEIAVKIAALDAQVMASGRPDCMEEELEREGRRQLYAVTKAPWKDDSGAIIGIVDVTRDITERKRHEERIRSLLAEKEILLKEVHHRIKNHMGTMEGLLTLQAGTLTEPAAVQALQDAERRLHSMGILYDKLYRSENFEAMSLREYLPTLVAEVVDFFPPVPAVQVSTMVEDITLGTRQLSTLGMIVNEAITNSMKHAFPGRDAGRVSVTARRTGRRVRISLMDNGVGVPEQVIMGSAKGFGFHLMDTLARQLEGSLRVERQEGTVLILEFDTEE
jgi:PAS domain S-box-containing protein